MLGRYTYTRTYLVVWILEISAALRNRVINFENETNITERLKNEYKGRGAGRKFQDFYPANRTGCPIRISRTLGHGTSHAFLSLLDTYTRNYTRTYHVL